MVTIKSLLQNTHLPNSSSEKLDVELLLAAALNKPKSYLYTYPEYNISSETQAIFQTMVNRRRQGEPIAYILGIQGFWSLDLQVSPQTLIPRPDTELLVETCLTHLTQARDQALLDLGTGTGAIALAIASERPDCTIIGVDYNKDIVTLAQSNQQHLHLNNVSFIQSDWFEALSGKQFHIIASNPPYIEIHDPHLQQGDVRFEPLSALVSGEDGLNDIRLIIQQAPDHLFEQGWLFLEHGYRQAHAVQTLLTQRGFMHIKTITDLGGNERVTGGQWLCNTSNESL